jgi:hypothetical protein
MKEGISKSDTAIYDWIFWISIAVIVVWMILKAVGVISSPVWQELLPFAGGLAALAAYFQKTGKHLQKIDNIEYDLHEFKTDTKAEFKEIRAELKTHDNRLIRIEAKLA